MASYIKSSLTTVVSDRGLRAKASKADPMLDDALKIHLVTNNHPCPPALQHPSASWVWLWLQFTISSKGSDRVATWGSMGAWGLPCDHYLILHPKDLQAPLKQTWTILHVLLRLTKLSQSFRWCRKPQFPSGCLTIGEPQFLLVEERWS